MRVVNNYNDIALHMRVF